MADGSPKTPAPSAVAAQARAGAPAAQGDMDRIREQADAIKAALGKD